MRSDPRPLLPHLENAAASFLGAFAWDDVDPEGTVSAPSRRLCAGLGVLAQATHAALGGANGPTRQEVGIAGAMLSLLTKVDDQVIDARAFHCGLSRREARAKTQRFLAPTLASMRDAKAASDEPRCRFAADLGARLAALGPRTRVEGLLEIVASGWEVQADAVATLTRAPDDVTLAEVERVTRAISGVWLLMIAAIGAVPAEPRPLTREEIDAFVLWGDAIQKADALTDLAKDIRDGHTSTFPVCLLHERAPEACALALAAGDTTALDALIQAHAVDQACLDAPAVNARLERARLAHAGLGEVPALLDWVRSHLSARYWARRG
jgi:hypothetical protein